MHFRPFYLGCLAHASYLIGSAGDAAVIDPQRDVDQYIAEAEAHGLTIRYVIETHLHADFVSGHRELAERTGAEIVFGARAEAEFPHRAVRHGDELSLGRIILRAMETPGHTPESISWVVVDTREGDRPLKVFTGDALFIGDVGRPDLVGAKGYSAAEMASMLYDSLHAKLLALPDEVEVWPAHGAGSACGRNISSQMSSTIGEQRQFNYACRPMSREEFVRLMTADLDAPPKYFPATAEANRVGAGSLERNVAPLSPEEARNRIAEGAVVLDVRDSAGFGAAHIPESINIGLDGQYASWAGSLLDASASIVIVSDGVPQSQEAAMRLARVGLENVAGYLDGGIAAWVAAGFGTESLPQIPVDELRARIEDGEPLHVIDVRTPSEYASGHVPGALNAPLSRLQEEVPGIPRARLAVICAGGYRSAAAASLLQKHGYRELFNVIGGTAAWTGAGYEVTTPGPQ